MTKIQSEWKYNVYEYVSRYVYIYIAGYVHMYCGSNIKIQIVLRKLHEHWNVFSRIFI